MFKKVICILLLFLSGQMYAGTVKKSKLIEYAGYKYYIHKVKKQETLYALSKAYGVSIRSIKALNNKKNTNLQEGELLRIPVEIPQRQVAGSNLKRHKVLKGETVYSLSKKYNVSKADLIAANKGIRSILKEGQLIYIPQVKKIAPRYDDMYYYHVVEKGETFASIARQYSLRLQKLKKINRSLSPNVLHPNDIVRIPISKARTEVAMLRIKKANEQKKQEQEQDAKDGSKELIPGEIVEEQFVESQFKEQYKMLLLLPITNSWTGMINYYKGIRTAINENKDIPGFELETTVHDTQNSVYKTKAFLAENATNVDFILGSYSKKLFSLSIPYASPKTTVVSLLSKNTQVYENKYVLQLNTTEKTINTKIADYIVNERSSENIICSDGKEFARLFLIDSMDNYKKTEWLSFYLNQVQDKLSYDFTKDYSEEIEMLLDKEKKNVFILPENNRKIVAQILSVLDMFRNYEIEVIGYYKWRFFETLEPDLFFRLNMTYFSPFYYDVEQQQLFVKSYFKEFDAYPDEFSFMGYDMMQKILHGIQTGGTHFYRNMDTIIKHEEGGFENLKLYKVTFNSDYTTTVE